MVLEFVSTPDRRDKVILVDAYEVVKSVGEWYSRRRITDRCQVFRKSCVLFC